METLANPDDLIEAGAEGYQAGIDYIDEGVSHGLDAESDNIHDTEQFAIMPYIAEECKNSYLFKRAAPKKKRLPVQD